MIVDWSLGFARCNFLCFINYERKFNFNFALLNASNPMNFKMRSKNNLVSDVQIARIPIILVETIFLFCVWLSNRLKSVYLSLILAKYLKVGSGRRSIWNEYLLRNKFGICGAFGSDSRPYIIRSKRPKTRLDINCFDQKL